MEKACVGTTTSGGEDPGWVETTAKTRCCVAHTFADEHGNRDPEHTQGVTFLIQATFVADKKFASAPQILQKVARKFHQTNLDKLDCFQNENTTCERFALQIHNELSNLCKGKCIAIRVLVRESDVAFVEYEQSLSDSENAPSCSGLYRVAVRARCMVARLLDKGLVGNTLVVDTVFSGSALEQAANFLIDICFAEKIVHDVVNRIHQTNVDQCSNAVDGMSSELICEFLWHEVAQALQESIANGGVGASIDHVHVIVTESDVTRTEYSRQVKDAANIRPVFCAQIIDRQPGFCGPAIVAQVRFLGDELDPTRRLIARGEAAHWLRVAMERLSIERSRTSLDDKFQRSQRGMEKETYGETTGWCEEAVRSIWNSLVAAIPPTIARRLTRIEVLIKECDELSVKFARSLYPDPSGGCGLVLLEPDEMESNQYAEESGSHPDDNGSLPGGVREMSPTGIAHKMPIFSLLKACNHQVAFVAKSHKDSHTLRLARAMGGLPLFCPGTVDDDDGDKPFLKVKQGKSTQPLDARFMRALKCRESVTEDPAEYLAAKVDLDDTAINSEVRLQLVNELRESRDKCGENKLRVLDIGAGALSMLPRVESIASEAGFACMDYSAFESDAFHFSDSSQVRAKLFQRGYKCIEAPTGTSTSYLTQAFHCLQGETNLEVQLQLCTADIFDVAESNTFQGREGSGIPTLIVAAAFADLIHPDALLALSFRLAPGALVYLPITFDGQTNLVPASPGKANVPSDTRVIQAYHRHLISQGQFIDTADLCQKAEEADFKLLGSASSDWKIAPESRFHSFMLDFLASGTAAELWPLGWSLAGWRARAVERNVWIIVRNRDLLFRAPLKQHRRLQTFVQVSFIAPRNVQAELRVLCANERKIPDHKLEICSSVSSVSTGTELLVYRGQLDNQGPLDSAIQGMVQSSMEYPLEYGYSLVGVVKSVGARVPLSFVGRRVFAFTPHAAAALIDETAILLVPKDIADGDAAYLAAAETSISIVHDAHPRAGDLVCVHGAGIIGLLVVAKLSHLGLHVVVFDPDEGRRQLALTLGAARAYAPPSSNVPLKSSSWGDFDISIECSGNPAALQNAIDSTRDYGKVVIASWYGTKSMSLNLGTRFHRSHIRLISSQVSTIPGKVSDLWSKSRRFGEAWNLLRRVCPSRTMSAVSYHVSNVAQAYAALDNQEALTCLITYGDDARS